MSKSITQVWVANDRKSTGRLRQGQRVSWGCAFWLFTGADRLLNLARVNWKWWTLGTVVALAAAAGLAAGLQRSRQRQRHQQDVLVAAAFTGDAAAFESLRAGREATVAMMEEFIRRHYQVDAGRIEQDIAALASSEPEVRLLALARLTLLPERAGSVLRTNYDRLAAGPARECLHHLIQERPRLQKQIAGFLTGLYSGNFHQLFVRRRSALLADCQDIPAQLFFAYAPFEEVWRMLRDSPAELQLRFLLLRLYTGRDDQAVSCLARFSAPDILKLARQTWWPIEMDASPGEAKAASVTLAGVADGTVAAHLFRLTTRPAPQAGAPPEWVSFDRWFRWTYVFRYKEPMLGREGVAYAESEVHRGRTERPAQGLLREKGEAGLWLPERTVTNLVGPGHCEMVRTVPPTVRVPVVAMSRQEAGHWQAGGVFEWARPLFTAAMQSHLRFEPNQNPPPQVFPGPEEAARDKTRKRWRRRT
jgi:hypothetical protein